MPKNHPEDTRLEEVELTWGRFGRAFWLLFWRAASMCVIGGAATSGMMRWGMSAVLGNPGPPGMALLIWISLSMLGLRMMLRKRYRGFRIALISTDGPTARLMSCIPDIRGE